MGAGQRAQGAELRAQGAGRRAQGAGHKVIRPPPSLRCGGQARP